MVGLLHRPGVEAARTLLVTGPAPGSGVSTLALNLAACIAATGRRTLLIDANFAAPQMQTVFGLNGAPGLADILSAPDVSVAPAESTSIPHLAVLPAGRSVAASLPLLASESLKRALDKLSSDYGFVVIDGPPLTHADAHVFAATVDGTLCCFRARASRRGTVDSCARIIHRLGARLIGWVLTDVRTG